MNHSFYELIDLDILQSAFTATDSWKISLGKELRGHIQSLIFFDGTVSRWIDLGITMLINWISIKWWPGI